MRLANRLKVERFDCFLDSQGFVKGDNWQSIGERELRKTSRLVLSSATAGTVFADRRKPLRLWFHVMWLMLAQKTGRSARNLCATSGFGSYQTAWGWWQKLRGVKIRTGRARLSGRVEVDEAYVGGQKEGTRGRGAEGKTAVLVAAEGDPKKKLGRVRLRCVDASNRRNVERFIGGLRGARRNGGERRALGLGATQSRRI